VSDPIDILIPLGPGSKWDNNELRYCLRSICANLTGWRRIYIVGEPVDWLQKTPVCRHVPHEQESVNKEARIARRVAWAFRNLPLSDRVLFMNDDHVILKPADARTYPNYYKASLERCAKVHPETSCYGKSLRATDAALKAARHPAHSYDIHTPIIYERNKFLALRDWWDRSAELECGYVVKSVYGNVHGIGGERRPDCLLGKPRTYAQIEQMLANKDVFSFNDSGLNADLKRWLADRFPDQCRLELTG
jgi:hypothetical protein